MELALEIRKTVTAFLQQRQTDQGMHVPLGPTTAVFGEGLLDSVALIELVAAVEAVSGQTLDMLRFDPASVETLEDLITELTSALAG